ncbi:hypothetical protein TUM4637_05320 [Shewanella hafniensis]|nr:hypothetical protein TUM4637_05320 [Shewanella hafniensis]
MGNVKKCIRENRIIPIPITMSAKQLLIYSRLKTPEYVPTRHNNGCVDWYKSLLSEDG